MVGVVSLGKTLNTNFLVLSETDVKPGGPVFMNFMFTLKPIRQVVFRGVREIVVIVLSAVSRRAGLAAPTWHVFVLNVVVVSMFPCRAKDPL